jgi:aminoglycoside phosphotransferase (APT) family kinase protein
MASPSVARVTTTSEITANAQLGAAFDELDGVNGPYEFELISGGRSNLTYAVTPASGQAMVLRRPPLGHVLPKAHDVVREARIMSAFAGTAVPVPGVLMVCEDTSVIGAPFYVMELVDGHVLRNEGDVREHLPEGHRATASHELIDSLVEIHRLDPAEIGLGDLGASENYIERQLRRWKRQFDSSKTRELPVVDDVHEKLAARVPPQRRTSVVHGDFRLDNCIVSASGKVRAVLDWELAALGDPLADLGLLLVYWARPSDELQGLLTGAATSLPGFLEHAALVERYAERSSADVSDLGFYVAFSYWRLACIFEGVAMRYLNGAMAADDDVDGSRYAEQAELLAQAAHDKLAD